MQIDIQRAENGSLKNYTIAYVVFEKVCECSQYPPDGKVTFEKVKIYCDDKLLPSPNWSTSFVENVCNNRAKIVDPNTVEITWDTNFENPSPELIAKSQRSKKL